MRETKFTIEIYGNTVFEGFTKDENWNGWACPYFAFEESQRIVEAHRKTGQQAGFDNDSDAFYFNIQDEEEFYQPIEVDGKKFYPIGNSSWIWSEDY
jgi:hypothetical protein